MREIAYIEPDAYDDGESLDGYKPPTHDQLEAMDDPKDVILEVLKWKGSVSPDYFEDRHDIWDPESYIEELEEDGLVGYDMFRSPHEVEEHLDDLHDL